jgi:hypothetical protein
VLRGPARPRGPRPRAGAGGFLRPLVAFRGVLQGVARCDGAWAPGAGHGGRRRGRGGRRRWRARVAGGARGPGRLRRRDPPGAHGAATRTLEAWAERIGTACAERWNRDCSPGRPQPWPP